MFAYKKKYYLIVENIKDFDFKRIKKLNKFIIIYRRNKKVDNFGVIKKFRNYCKLKHIKFFIANDIRLASTTNADGLYISASNRDFKFLHLKKSSFQIIGSAHNFKEINQKRIQGCSTILLSKLFKVNYDKSNSFLGIVKFNNYLLFSNKLIHLGGIKSSNLNSLKNIKCEGFAILSELKKKPAKIISRLF